LAIHVVKERPARRHPTSDEVGVLQERKRNARRTCVDPGVLGHQGP
jgi:hypothetical protein